MSEKRMLRFGLAALVVVVLVGLAASAVQQSAWSQGFMMGLIAGGDSGDSLAQYVLYNSHGAPIWNGFGFIFKLGFLFFLFLMAAKIFHFWSWRQSGQHGDAWQGHWHQGPPWARQPERPSAPTQPTAAEQTTGVSTPINV